MKRVFLLLIVFVSLYASDVCKTKEFSLHLNKEIPLKVILNDLSKVCNISIVFNDEYSKKILNEKVGFINVDDIKFKDFLRLIFDKVNLFYKLKDNILYLSYFKNKTFKIDYIPNNFSGSTNMSSDTNDLKSDYQFDFWESVSKNIKQILNNVYSLGKVNEPVIDKNAGLVTVRGNKLQLKEVEKYINNLNSRLHKEVLIDVKIYSVTLSKSHKTGIDWSKLQLELPDSSVPLKSSYIVGSKSIFNSAKFSAGALLNFLAKNGDVNSISNPKIVTLNNQKAIINIGDTVNYKYVSKVYVDNGTPIQEYTIDSKFVGVLLDITPQISDNNEIILNINPRISTFKDISQLQNQLVEGVPPNTQENSLLTVVRLKNNQTLVLGGLITDDKSLQVNGIPVLKEIPLIKYLFSSKEYVSNKKELVFVITPRIINLDKKVTLKDYGYKKLPTLEDLNVK
jgi:general secretion pathway protein D